MTEASDTETSTAIDVWKSPVSSKTISVDEIGAPSTAAATAPIPAQRVDRLDAGDQRKDRRCGVAERGTGQRTDHDRR